MALSVNLQLRQSQSLVMTPQLMQSIRLLQFSHVELVQFIEREIERNPLLELAGEGTERHAAEAAEPGEGSGEAAGEAGESDGWAADPAEAGAVFSETIDSSYENVFQDDHGEARLETPQFADSWKSMPGADGARMGESYDIDDFAARPVTLRDHLSEQVAFTFTSPAERLVAMELVDRLDEAGYLRDGIDDIAERFGVHPARVDEVLRRAQKFDPPGLFARSLGECLALQLERKDRLDPAMVAFVDNLDLLARRDFASLGRICGVGEDDLLDMLAEIRALDPKPGTRFESSQSEIVVPDVTVRRADDGGWLVELNPETLPRVLVNHSYYAEVAGTLGAGGGQEFLSECLQSASWLTRSLDQRARTILKVASEIVRHQDAFLLHGVDRLRPLNLKTVAEAIGMHESTVSRVTSNKFIMTPRGVFELKYFFTVSIAAAGGGGDAHSAEAVRHRIRALIDEEQPFAVLSDDDLVDLLKKAGIEIARRTVAKYREAMSIPSSVQRRREKRARANAAVA